MRRALCLSLALSLVLSGPGAAQVVQTVVTGGSSAPVVAPVPVDEIAAPLAPGESAASLQPTLAAPTAPITPGLEPIGSAGWVTQIRARPVSDGAAVYSRATAAAAPADGRLARLVAPFKGALAIVASALSGDGRAGRALPGLAHLGQDLAAPKVDGRAETAQASGSDFFNRKTAFESEDANFYDFEPWASVPDWSGKKGGGRGGKGGKGGGDEKSPDPKYASRPIAFNDTTLPSVAMRPDRPVEALLVQAIDAAKDEIFIAMYEFKLREVLKALRRAKARGVKIHIVMDHSNTFPRPWPGSEYIPHRSMELQSLINEGFDITFVRGMWIYGIQHNKFMVLDGKLAQFGSYNYTWTSEGHHFENALFSDEAKRVEGLLAYWKYLRSLSVGFDEARAKVWPKELPPPPADATPSIEINGAMFPAYFFSPNGGGEDWVVKAIDKADESIDISMFTLRSTRVVEALLRAKGRKVKVRVILDKSQYDSDTSKAFGQWLAFHKIRAKELAGPDPNGPEFAQKDHNKLMIIDGKVVETGSFNYTKNAALMSFENGHFINDPVDVGAFVAFFEDMFQLGKAIEVPETEPRLPTDEELVSELMREPEPVPPPVQWPEIPAVRQIAFNNETLPSFAVKPQHPLKDLIVKAIGSSEKSIHLALYEFTLPEILDALRDARKRKVEVHVIIDYAHAYPRGTDHTGQERQMSPEIKALIDEGFDIQVLRGVLSTGAMHNKFAVFDGKMVELGSYNWAKTAEENHFENVIFSDTKARVDFYMRYWEWMRGMSQSVKDAEDYPWTKHRPGPAPVDGELAVDLNGTKLPRTAVSPGGRVEEVLIKAIEAAKDSIEVAMFSFYSQTVAEALLRAKERNVNVRIVLDENQSKLMKLDEWFAYYGFAVKIVAGPDDWGNVMFEKMHNKFMLIDLKVFETGSFNYTPNAEKNNFDNANFFDEADIVAAAAVYFEMLFSRGYAPRKPKRPPTDAATASEAFQGLMAGAYAHPLEAYAAGDE